MTKPKELTTAKETKNNKYWFIITKTYYLVRVERELFRCKDTGKEFNIPVGTLKEGPVSFLDYLSMGEESGTLFNSTAKEDIQIIWDYRNENKWDNIQLVKWLYGICNNPELNN